MVTARLMAHVGLTGALLLGSVAPAFADDSAAAKPPGQCDPRSEWTKLNGAPKYVVTHVHGYHAPPGGEITVTRTAEVIKKLVASASGTVEGSVSARFILAKASAKYSVTLAAAGERTSSHSETVSYRLGSAKKDRDYALYQGRRYWTGTWQTYRCGEDGNSTSVIHSGSWRSFQANNEGGALCPASRYKKGTLPYKACKATSG